MCSKFILILLILLLIYIISNLVNYRYRLRNAISCRSSYVEPRLHVLGVATHEDEFLKNYKQSFVKNTSYTPKILGMNTKWNGFLDKFYHVKS